MFPGGLGLLAPDLQVAISVHILPWLVHRILGVCVHTSLHVWVLVSRHPAVLGAGTSGLSSGWSLLSPEPVPLSSSPILGSTDPSRRLELLLLFLAALHPSPPPLSLAGGGGEDKLSLGSLRVPWKQGESGIAHRCRGHALGKLRPHAARRKSQAALSLPPPSL